MKTLIAVAALFVGVALYVTIVRPWLRRQEWSQGYFRAIEPVELWLWSKSESILWSRFLMVLGVLPGFLSAIGAFDVTPFLFMIPDQYKPFLLAIITVCGIVGEALRRDTTKPLAVVALPEDKPPEVEAAIERAEAANERAVTAVAQAVEEKKV